MDNIIKTLETWGIAFKTHQHPAVFTCEDAAKHCSHLPGLASKNLFLRNKKGDAHYLVTLPAAKTANLKSLGLALGVDKLSFASAERLQRFLNVTPGSVSPFGLIYDTNVAVRYLVDQELLQAELQSFHPNNNQYSLEISTEEFRNYLTKLPHETQYIDTSLP